jgi:molecular chaperone GrpE
MSKNKEPKIELPSKEEVAAYGGAPAGAQSPSEPPGQPAAEADPLAEAQRQRNEWQDKCLRARAELQNMQRRLSCERAEAVRYAISEFVRDLLATVDDFERSFEAAENAKSPQSVIEGMRIVYDHLLKILKTHHVTPIEAAGQPFDPAEHQAITQQPSDEYDTPTVLQQLQRGYKLHDRVIRPAKVIISAPSQPAAQPTSEAGESAEPSAGDA